MKKLSICLLVAFCISCKKDTMLLVGHYYNVKGDVFNKGVYQPVCPCRLDSLYIDPITNLPYAMIYGGQRGKMVYGTYNPSEKIEWYIPQDDLR